MKRFACCKRALAALILIASMLSAGPALASITMRWPEYAREILLNNQSLRNGIKNVEAAYYSVLASVGAQRPRLGISASESWVTAHQGQSHVNAANIAIALTHRFDLTGKYSLNEQQYILGYEIARAQFDTGLNSLMAIAEETWWSTVLARENVKLQHEILRQRSENHRITTEKFRQELVPRLDIIRSEARVVEAETLVKSAETAYQNLLANLSYLAGGLDIEPVEADLQVPSFDVSLDYEDALIYRPDVRAARLSVERAKLVEKIMSKGLEPTLDFGAQYTIWAAPEFSSTPNKGELGLSLSLSIPILDGNQTRYSTLNADRLVQAAEANLEALQEETRRDIIVAMNNWRNASATEADKKLQVERSEEELRITGLMYTEGMGAQIDLINAQTEYQGVRTQYLNSVKEMYIALVALRKAIGDYSPDEDGNWNEAVARYGKGNEVLGEVGLKKLRDQRENESIKFGRVEPKPVAERDIQELNARLYELNDQSKLDMTAAEMDALLKEMDQGR